MSVALSQEVRSVKWYFSIMKPSIVIIVSVREFCHDINSHKTLAQISVWICHYCQRELCRYKRYILLNKMMLCSIWVRYIFLYRTMFDVFVLGSCAPGSFVVMMKALLWWTNSHVSYITFFCSIIKQGRTCNNVMVWYYTLQTNT